MPGRPHTSEQILTILAEAPGRIAASTAGVASARLRAAPAPGEWSPTEVLAHLRACADVWGTGIARMLAEDLPTIRAVSPRTWVHGTDYPELEYAPSLRAYTEQRAALLAVLEPLPPEGWSRAATVAGAGRPFRHTVLSYAERLATHERPHVQQIARTVEAFRTDIPDPPL